MEQISDESQEQLIKMAALETELAISKMTLEMKNTNLQILQIDAQIASLTPEPESVETEPRPGYELPPPKEDEQIDEETISAEATPIQGDNINERVPA